MSDARVFVSDGIHHPAEIVRRRTGREVRSGSEVKESVGGTLTEEVHRREWTVRVGAVSESKRLAAQGAMELQIGHRRLQHASSHQSYR